MVQYQSLLAIQHDNGLGRPSSVHHKATISLSQGADGVHSLSVSQVRAGARKSPQSNCRKRLTGPDPGAANPQYWPVATRRNSLFQYTLPGLTRRNLGFVGSGYLIARPVPGD